MPSCPVVLAVDISGSTSNSPLYWQRVKVIAEELLAKCPDAVVILWNHAVQFVGLSYLLSTLERDKSLSTGGTSTSTLCESLLSLPAGFRLVLVTDGEVCPFEAKRVHERIVRRSETLTVPWIDVDAYMINARSELDVSVVMPFICGQTYRVTLVRCDDESVRASRMHACDALPIVDGISTVADFEEQSAGLLDRFVADTAFGQDPEMRIGLLAMQQRLLRECARAAAAEVGACGIAIDRDSVAAAAEAWYAGNSSGAGVVAKVQQMLTLFTAAATQESNLSRQRFLQTSVDACAVVSQMPAPDEKEEEKDPEPFEDPVTYNFDVPALTFRRDCPPVFGADADVELIKHTPFRALGNPAFEAALIAAFDNVLGAETLRELHERAACYSSDNDGGDSYGGCRRAQSTMLSPTSRQPLLQHVMALGEGPFVDRMRAALFARLLFGGDTLYGSPGAWTVVVCHVLRRAAVERSHSEAVARGIDALVARVMRDTTAKLSLSGAGLHPTTRAPLGAAVLYCVESMLLPDPARNRMPEMLGAFEAFEHALSVVGVDVSDLRPRVETLRWAGRLIRECRANGGSGAGCPALVKACAAACAPFARTLCIGAGVQLLLDAPQLIEGHAPDADARLALLLCSGFNPANETLGRLGLNKSPPLGGAAAASLLGLGGHYSAKSNDEIREGVPVLVHPLTLRPPLMVPSGRDGEKRTWEEAAEEAGGPVSKQLPIHKLILEYFLDRRRFPAVGDEAAMHDLIGFMSRASKVKKVGADVLAAPVAVLPVNIITETTEVIAEVAEAMGLRRACFGEEACTVERIVADIGGGERREARAKMEALFDFGAV